MSTLAPTRSPCVFCNIVNKLDNTEILFEDEDICIFRDIKPASKFHILTIPKQHIEDVKCLTAADKELVSKMLATSKDLLIQNGLSVEDARFGYHWPPFRSVRHLHLHTIAPESQMGFVSKMIFRKDSYWFVSIKMEDSELDSSELGTQTYWKDCYTKEILNFDEHGDPGDVWFGEDSACRVINWICKCGFDKAGPVIDLGCGNGYTLSELAREGFTNLLGIDYCPEAITLAEKVSQTEFSFIKYQVFDITQDDVSKLGKFTIVHDKGTYDAIGLNPDNAKEHRMKYIDSVNLLLTDGGLFVITSCNWTEEELMNHFCEKLKLKCVIPTPQFKFGGKVGSVVSSVVFEK